MYKPVESKGDQEVKKVVESEAPKAAPCSEPSKAAPVRTKYEMCKNWRDKGVCKYGEKCLFAHGDKELTSRVTKPEKPAEPASPATADTASAPAENSNLTAINSSEPPMKNPHEN